MWIRGWQNLCSLALDPLAIKLETYHVMSCHIISCHIISYHSTQNARSPGRGGRVGRKKDRKKTTESSGPLPTVLPILTGGNGDTVPQLDTILDPPHFPTSVFPSTEAHCASDIHPAMPLVLPSGRTTYHHVYQCLRL